MNVLEDAWDILSCAQERRRWERQKQALKDDIDRWHKYSAYFSEYQKSRINPHPYATGMGRGT